METYTVYRLTFKTQLHLGRTSGPAQEGSFGLEKTVIYIPADTLFSAICQTWSTFYDTQSLTVFLNGYAEDNAVLPFALTSAFPYADNVYFLPKPLPLRESKDTPEKVNAEAKKKIKKLQFVSGSLFQYIISGHLPYFSGEESITINATEICSMNSEKVWGTTEERDQLKELLTDNDREKSDDNTPVIWKTATRPRVSIDRQTDESSIWHVETVQFNTGCGLWFAAQFDSDETKHKIETLLRVLGGTGIGGERNAGYGMFDFTEATLEMPTPEAGSQFVTLSPICPKSPEQLAQLLKGDIAYTLNPLKGWVSTTGTASLRKQVNMFAEGSVLHASETQIGRLVDLRPDNWEHPVYRYGYAWQVGTKGASE